MKKLLLVVFLLQTLNLSAQQNVNDSLSVRIKKLETALDEKNYTRVPNREFDNMLDNQIQSKVFNFFITAFTILSLIIAGGGLSLFRGLQQQSRKQVDDLFLELKKAVEVYKNEISEKQTSENEMVKTKIEMIKEFQQKIDEKQDLKLKEISESIEKVANEHVTFKSDVEEKIKEDLRMIMEDIADHKIEKAKDEGYKSRFLIIDLNDFIENINKNLILIGLEKKKLLIDTLMRCFYHTIDPELQKLGFEDNYKEMIKLLEKFENKVKLLPETYANAAIALVNQYEFYNNVKDKNLAIDCCNKSFDVAKDYGLPYALLLEVYMIAYINAFDDKEKNENYDCAKRVLYSMNSSQSLDLHLEAVERLMIDKEVKYLSRYIDEAEKQFPEDVLALKEKAIISIHGITNWSDYERYVNLLNKLYSESEALRNKYSGS